MSPSLNFSFVYLCSSAPTTTTTTSTGEIERTQFRVVSNCFLDECAVHTRRTQAHNFNVPKSEGTTCYTKGSVLSAWPGTALETQSCVAMRRDANMMMVPMMVVVPIFFSFFPFTFMFGAICRFMIIESLENEMRCNSANVAGCDRRRSSVVAPRNGTTRSQMMTYLCDGRVCACVCERVIHETFRGDFAAIK